MERVDKQWKEKGLAAFSTSAILGTLAHYGVKLDEAGLKTAATDMVPLQLAGSWRGVWKGTGQFQTFPYAAAEELSRRLFPERSTPMQIGELLSALSAHAVSVANGGVDGELVATFDKLDKALPTLPAKKESRDLFLQELVSIIDRFGGIFNALPKDLAQAGKVDHANRFALVQETLFPDRAGCVTALVRAMSGQREAGLAELKKFAEDTLRDVYARYSALDALLLAGAMNEVRAVGLGIFDEAAKQERWQLADTVVHLLADLVRNGTIQDEAFVREVGQRFQTAHQHASH